MPIIEDKPPYALLRVKGALNDPCSVVKGRGDLGKAQESHVGACPVFSIILIRFHADFNFS